MELQQLKEFLHTKLLIKDLGRLQYFLGLEFSRDQSGVFLSQRKNVVDMLEEVGLQDAKPANTPVETYLKLEPNIGESLEDASKYKRIVGKLIYLTVTRPYLSFTYLLL